jgi:hypothetical protein
MDRRRSASAVIAAALLGLLGGCGSDAADTISDEVNDEAAAETTGAGTKEDTAGSDAAVEDGPSDAGAPAVVTVDGQDYPADPALGFAGGACRVNEDPDRPGRAFVAYFAASGERVELSFLAPLSDMSDASDEDPFLGSLNIGGTLELSLASSEPWPWTDDGGSMISGSFTMEDRDGNPAEVTFDIACP